MFHVAGAGVSLIDASSGPRSKPEVLNISPTATNGQFSPNGKWIAYSSAESGRTEIYVASASGQGARTTVSPDGGIQPRWSRDGKELFYLTRARDRMMVVPVDTQGAFKAGAARELFRLDVADALGHLYDVTPDGRRFLVNERVGERVVPLTVVLNWTSIGK
jgi:dipeptidyl aminopeptidase/acylaminoacyl peptidase